MGAFLLDRVLPTLLLEDGPGRIAAGWPLALPGHVRLRWAWAAAVPVLWAVGWTATTSEGIADISREVIGAEYGAVGVLGPGPGPVGGVPVARRPRGCAVSEVVVPTASVYQLAGRELLQLLDLQTHGARRTPDRHTRGREISVHQDGAKGIGSRRNWM